MDGSLKGFYSPCFESSRGRLFRHFYTYRNELYIKVGHLVKQCRQDSSITPAKIDLKKAERIGHSGYHSRQHKSCFVYSDRYCIASNFRSAICTCDDGFTEYLLHGLIGKIPTLQLFKSSKYSVMVYDRHKQSFKFLKSPVTVFGLVLSGNKQTFAVVGGENNGSKIAIFDLED